MFSSQYFVLIALKHVRVELSQWVDLIMGWESVHLFQSCGYFSAMIHRPAPKTPDLVNARTVFRRSPLHKPIFCFFRHLAKYSGLTDSNMLPNSCKSIPLFIDYCARGLFNWEKLSAKQIKTSIAWSLIRLWIPNISSQQIYKRACLHTYVQAYMHTNIYIHTHPCKDTQTHASTQSRAHTHIDIQG